MSFGAGLVVLGMVLNSFLVGDADAQVGGENTILKNVFCENLVIQDKNGKWRGYFGLDSDGGAILQIFDEDNENPVAYLGGNPDKNNEMLFYLQSKSKTDKREASMSIDENGGRLGCFNKMGENVAFIAVANDGGGGVKTKDKYGYTR
jgi:hypothetical protein|tara:strand:- start:1638 stop:2081 length:444 start_codon:yes stop_codon:yes gene_type:complete